MGGATVHFASVDTAGRYRVKKSPYYELDINIIADLERFFVSLEKAAAGEEGSETIHRHYNLQLALFRPLTNLSIF